MYEEKTNKIKRLSFKNTKFISEGHMLSRVPDEFKKEGNKFIMRDSANNEYLVEWKESEPNVTKKLNMQMVNEQTERMKYLWGYKPKEHMQATTPKMRANEEKEFGNILGKARTLLIDKS